MNRGEGGEVGEGQVTDHALPGGMRGGGRGGIGRHVPAERTGSGRARTLSNRKFCEIEEATSMTRLRMRATRRTRHPIGGLLRPGSGELRRMRQLLHGARARQYHPEG